MDGEAVEETGLGKGILGTVGKKVRKRFRKRC